MSMIGHNTSGIDIEIEVRLFNSIQRDVGGSIQRPMTLPAGATVADILSRLQINLRDVFLVFCNGRDVTRDMPGTIDTDYAPEQGDVIAISGAIPYSWGYGAPVV